jgi:hypothetical protein
MGFLVYYQKWSFRNFFLLRAESTKEGADVMTKVSETESYFKTKIGVSSDIAMVWEVFKSFGRETVESEDKVALVFQCGAAMDELNREELFYFDFSTRISNYANLHCEFVFELTKELNELEACTRYFETDGEIEDYFNMVVNLEEFQIPLKFTPLRLKIYQQEVYQTKDFGVDLLNMNTFDKMLDINRYENDGVCIGFLKSNEKNKLNENDYRMNELIFDRIHYLGVAYNLPSIKWWDEYATVRLNQSQVKNLIEDLNFLKSVVNDQVIHSVIH